MRCALFWFFVWSSQGYLERENVLMNRLFDIVFNNQSTVWWVVIAVLLLVIIILRCRGLLRFLDLEILVTYPCFFIVALLTLVISLFSPPSRSLRTTNSTLTLRRNALIGGRGCLRLGFCSTCLGMLTPTYAWETAPLSGKHAPSTLTKVNKMGKNIHI